MENRVDQLERSVRRLQIQLRVCLGIAAVAVAGAMLGFADVKGAAPGLVRASQLQIEKDGKIIATLGPDLNGASLTMNRDATKVRMSSCDSYTGMQVHDSALGSSVILGMFEGLPTMSLHMGSEKPDILATVSAERADLILGRKGSGEGKLHLATTDTGAMCSMYDQSGVCRGTFALADKAGAALITFDENGKRIP